MTTLADPGLGPQLTYSTAEDANIHIYCSVQQVYPEPSLSLDIYSEQGGWADR